MPAAAFLFPFVRAALGASAVALVAVAATGCATVAPQPQNRPLTADTPAARERMATGANMIALSFSGGGLRATAFSFGALQALADTPAGNGADLFSDVAFISAVSGGALTAAYFGLRGPAAFETFRARVLDADLEEALQLSPWSPSKLVRLSDGGLNDPDRVARALDDHVFAGATLADLLRQGRPEVWINATDLYNRTAFPFIAPMFDGLCSDLAQYPVADAVVASMAVPLVFAPVVLQTFPDACRTPLPPWTAPSSGNRPHRLIEAAAAALRRYRNPAQMRYVKLVDGGLTDNLGLSGILVARTAYGTPYGPLSESEAVRLRRLLYLVVDAGRQPGGEWALRPEGPSAIDVAQATMHTMLEASSRLAADEFRAMMDRWRRELVAWRCALTDAQVRRHLPPQEPWQCDDVQFFFGTVDSAALDAATVERLRLIPTRLTLPPEQVEVAIEAGRRGVLASPELQAYRRARVGR